MYKSINIIVFCCKPPDQTTSGLDLRTDLVFTVGVWAEVSWGSILQRVCWLAVLQVLQVTLTTFNCACHTPVNVWWMMKMRGPPVFCAHTERKLRVPVQESVLDNLLWKQEFPNRECWIKGRGQHGRYIKAGLCCCFGWRCKYYFIVTIPNVMFLMGR